MKKEPIKVYQDYVEGGWDRSSLIEAVASQYEVRSALYPGSYVHITPSFTIPRVVYVDSDKKAKWFFAKEEVYTYIEQMKHYPEEAKVEFYGVDYYKDFLKEEGSFDLLISQYAGFISQACKKYLRKGGILLANNSHGDAGVAFEDVDYELIGVGNNRQGKWVLSHKNLKDYFVSKKEVSVTKEYLLSLNRGLGYRKSAGVYIFRKK